MTTNDYIPYGRQTIEEDDIRAVVEVLRSPHLTTGPKVKEFEQAVAKEVGARFGVAVSSGTAALHAALSILDLKPDDEVLVPALSFIATANAVLYAGARPVFVDSVIDGFNMDWKDAERKKTVRTRAIVPVHFAGEPCDPHIRRFARENNLVLIEDAAHALGAKQSAEAIGALADMTIFSFHPVKLITTGEGGMVTTNDPKLERRLRQFRHHGIDVDVTQRDARQQWSYDMQTLGFNYRLTDFQSALGLSQLKKLERFIQRREAIAQAYHRAFADTPILRRPPSGTSDMRHAWHLYVIRLNVQELGRTRDEAFQTLRSAGIGVHVHYQPIHLHSYYQRLGYRPGQCPVIESTFQTMLSLPIHPAMQDSEVDRVIGAVLQLTNVVSGKV